jgi:hypothetical protein
VAGEKEMEEGTQVGSMEAAKDNASQSKIAC